MSFDKLIPQDARKKSKEVEFDVAGEKVFFTAHEISALDRIALAVLQQGDKNFVTGLVVASIVDQHGKKMSLEQASKLPDEIAAKFFAAAMEVNYADKTEKN